MFRALIRFIKSPVHTFPALAAAIGCLVSGFSTFNGISEIFPNFGYSALAALGLAAIIQLGMLSSTLSLRDRSQHQPMLIAVICFTVVMSSFTSYVFYFRGFSEETIAKERRLERYDSLRGYLVDVRGQTSGVLGTLQEASAELGRRIEIESDTGGGLRNISNPYLQRLVQESDLSLDLRRVESGNGERYRFLTALEPRLGQMETEVAAALAVIDGEIEILTTGDQVDHDAMRSSYARASAVVPADRIREVRGEFTAPVVDAAILDTSALEEEEYWQRAVTDLVAGSPTAIVFAFIAVFIDTMIVFFAFVSGQSAAAANAPRVPLEHWMRMAYEQRFADGVRNWIAALDGVRVQRGRTVLHRLEVRRLTDERDSQCARLLRQDGYLRQVMLEDGQSHWCLTDQAYMALVGLSQAGMNQTVETSAAEVFGA